MFRISFRNLFAFCVLVLFILISDYLFLLICSFLTFLLPLCRAFFADPSDCAPCPFYLPRFQFSCFFILPSLGSSCLSPSSSMRFEASLKPLSSPFPFHCAAVIVWKTLVVRFRNEETTQSGSPSWQIKKEPDGSPGKAPVWMAC